MSAVSITDLTVDNGDGVISFEVTDTPTTGQNPATYCQIERWNGTAWVNDLLGNARGISQVWTPGTGTGPSAVSSGRCAVQGVQGTSAQYRIITKATFPGGGTSASFTVTPTARPSGGTPPTLTQAEHLEEALGVPATHNLVIDSVTGELILDEV